MVKEKKTPKKTNPQSPYPTTPSKNHISVPKPKNSSSTLNTPVNPGQKSLNFPKNQSKTTLTPTNNTNYSKVSSRLYQNTKSIDNKRNLKYKSESICGETQTPTKSAKKEFFVSKPKRPVMRPDNNYESGQGEVKRLARTPTKNSQRYVPSTNHRTGGTRMLTEDFGFFQNSSSVRNSGVKDRGKVAKIMGDRD